MQLFMNGLCDAGGVIMAGDPEGVKHIGSASVLDEAWRRSKSCFSSDGESTPSESESSIWRDKGDGEGERVLTTWGPLARRLDRDR